MTTAPPITFAVAADRVDIAARMLAGRGVAEPGGRVALSRRPNTPQWIVANLAVLTAGGVVRAAEPRSREAEVAEILARAVPFVHDGASPSRRDPRRIAGRPTARLRPPPAPDDVSHVQFTSGTTGLPKGVMLTHRGMVETTRAWVEIVGLRPGDRYPVVNPFSHIGGHKTGLLAALVAGATVYPVARFDAPAARRPHRAGGHHLPPGPAGDVPGPARRRDRPRPRAAHERARRGRPDRPTSHPR